MATLGQFAEILMPHESEEPILAPGPRAALFEFLNEIHAAKALAEVKVTPRRSALLYGPPGTGKTTFAHHFAARLGLPLALIQSESIVGSYVGETERGIGSLFNALAQTNGKVVAFFDEFDVLGGRRMYDQGASVARSNAVSTLLRRLERFEGIALAATNRHDQLDEAMWRRFGMQISIDLPEEDQCWAILKRYAAPFDLPEPMLDLLAASVVGASPSLLRQLMEGMKRRLVMGPRLSCPNETAAEVFAFVLSGIAPPPESTLPPLWAKRDSLLPRFAGLSWPPKKDG